MSWTAASFLPYMPKDRRMESRKCKGCDQVKPVDRFYVDRSRSDGLAIYCKECKQQMAKRSKYKNNPRYLKKWIDSTMSDISPKDY